MKRLSDVDRQRATRSDMFGLLALLFIIGVLAGGYFAIYAPDYQLQVLAGVIAFACLVAWYVCVKLRQRYSTT